MSCTAIPSLLRHSGISTCNKTAFLTFNCCHTVFNGWGKKQNVPHHMDMLWYLTDTLWNTKSLLAAVKLYLQNRITVFGKHCTQDLLIQISRFSSLSKVAKAGGESKRRCNLESTLQIDFTQRYECYTHWTSMDTHTHSILLLQAPWTLLTFCRCIRNNGETTGKRRARFLVLFTLDHFFKVSIYKYGVFGGVITWGVLISLMMMFLCCSVVWSYKNKECKSQVRQTLKNTVVIDD